MKKKTLVILLISVVALTNTVGVDATISWNYRDNEGFKTNSEYKLEATLSYDQSQLLKPGSDTLVWETSGENSDLVEIEKRDDGYYLITGSETGETKITCCTENRRSSLTRIDTFYIYIFETFTSILVLVVSLIFPKTRWNKVFRAMEVR